MEKQTGHVGISGAELTSRLFALVTGDHQDAEVQPVHVPLGDDGEHFLADPTAIQGPRSDEPITSNVSIGGTLVAADGTEQAGLLTYPAGAQDVLTLAHVSFPVAPAEN